MLVHAPNLSTQKAVVGGSHVLGQHRPHSEPCLKKVLKRRRRYGSVDKSLESGISPLPGTTVLRAPTPSCRFHRHLHSCALPPPQTQFKKIFYNKVPSKLSSRHPWSVSAIKGGTKLCYTQGTPWSGHARTPPWSKGQTITFVCSACSEAGGTMPAVLLGHRQCLSH